MIPLIFTVAFLVLGRLIHRTHISIDTRQANAIRRRR